jgi:hypothetical protein
MNGISINEQEANANVRHTQLRELLEQFPESINPITLIGTIGIAFNMEVNYTQDKKIIIIKEK